MRKTKADRQMDAAINKAYYLAFGEIPVSVMDIPAIHHAIKEAITQTLVSGKGSNLADTLKDLRAKYGRNLA
jgi:hypothetical protein